MPSSDNTAAVATDPSEPVRSYRPGVDLRTSGQDSGHRADVTARCGAQLRRVADELHNSRLTHTTDSVSGC